MKATSQDWANSVDQDMLDRRICQGMENCHFLKVNSHLKTDDECPPYNYRQAALIS